MDDLSELIKLRDALIEFKSDLHEITQGKGIEQLESIAVLPSNSDLTGIPSELYSAFKKINEIKRIKNELKELLVEFRQEEEEVQLIEGSTDDQILHISERLQRKVFEFNLLNGKCFRERKIFNFLTLGYKNHGLHISTRSCSWCGSR